MTHHSTPDVEDYDLIIVGTGSGNTIPGQSMKIRKLPSLKKAPLVAHASTWAVFPQNVCAHRRCRPQLSRCGATQHHGRAAGCGLEGIQQRVFGDRIDPIAEGGAAYRAGEETPNITLFHGEAAAFVAPRTLRIGDTCNPWEGYCSGDRRAPTRPPGHRRIRSALPNQRRHHASGPTS